MCNEITAYLRQKETHVLGEDVGGDGAVVVDVEDQRAALDDGTSRRVERLSLRVGQLALEEVRVAHSVAKEGWGSKGYKVNRSEVVKGAYRVAKTVVKFCTACGMLGKRLGISGVRLAGGC